MNSTRKDILPFATGATKARRNEAGTKHAPSNFFVFPSLLRTFVALLFISNLAASAAESEAYLLHLPGIGGHMRIDDMVTSGMIIGGIKAETRIHDWTNGNPGMPALGNYNGNQVEAQKIADQLAAVYRADPKRKLIVTSHSGGGAMAVFMLEKLPADVKIDTLLLLAPALSPKYDLSKALAHVSGKAYVFSSTLDPIEGIGTRAFGTMDRYFGDAAGNVGFSKPDKPLDAKQYEKLVGIPYNKAWTVLGNAGDHIGTMSRIFGARILAPLLLTGNLPQYSEPTTSPTTAPATPAK